MTTTIRLPDGVRDDLKLVARPRGQTLNGLIRQILWDWLKQNPPEQKTRN